MKMFKSALFVCLLLCFATGAFAQISDVQPGADDNGGSPACGASGTVNNVVGNPAPSYQLIKPCATSNPAFAYADIVSTLEGGPVSALTSAGFQVKTGSHCGGGSPRFQLDLDAHTKFVTTLSCTTGTMTDLGNGWTSVTFNTTQIQNAVIAAGGTGASVLTDMYILMDEGSDTPVSPQVGTPGNTIIDNIMVNGIVYGNAPLATAAVPTLSEYALMALAALLALAGVFIIRR